VVIVRQDIGSCTTGPWLASNGGIPQESLRNWLNLGGCSAQLGSPCYLVAPAAIGEALPATAWPKKGGVASIFP